MMKVITATMMATLLAGLSIPAYAGDTKFFPATMCQGSVYQVTSHIVPVGQSSAFVPDIYTISADHYTTGAAHNQATDQEMTMVCPIVRDVERSDGLGWTSLIINALNLSHTRNLTCTAQASYPNDYGFGSISSSTLGPLTDWTDMALSAVSVPTNGYMLIYCTIPRLDSGSYPSGLASYRIDE